MIDHHTIKLLDLASAAKILAISPGHLMDAARGGQVKVYCEEEGDVVSSEKNQLTMENARFCPREIIAILIREVPDLDDRYGWLWKLGNMEDYDVDAQRSLMVRAQSVWQGAAFDDVTDLYAKGVSDGLNLSLEPGSVSDGG